MADSRFQTDARPRHGGSPRVVVSGGASMPLTAVLAWVVPGLGHWYLGMRDRAVIFFVTTAVTFWTGIAVGGVKSTVHATQNGAWFAAQLAAGGQTLCAWALGTQVARAHPDDVRYTAYAPANNIAVVYTGVCGLLNLLIIIDALARCEAPVPQRASRPPPREGRA